MNISIRFKLLSVGVVAILSAAMSVFIVSLQEHQTIYAKSVKDNLEALTENTADDLLLLISEKSDPFLLKSVLLRFERYTDIKYAIIYDKNWNQTEIFLQPRLFDLAKESKLNIPEVHPKDLPLHVSIKGENIFSVHNIGENEHIEGYLLVAHEYLKPLEKSRLELLNLALPLLIGVLVVTISLMLIIIRQQLIPLMNLSNFTRRLSKQKDYSERFPVSGNDEVYTLAQDINCLLEVIDLESRVNHEQKQQLTQQKEAMTYLANYDQLTGLPNRRYIMSWLSQLLEQARVSNKKITLMYFDIDYFKSVNDRMGHEIGDKLLIEVGKIISGFLNEDQILARLAGDEFLIVLYDITNKDLTVELANRLTSAFKAPIYIDRWRIQTGISIGIADTDDSGYIVDDVINYADVAMYHSKHYAKGSVTVFQSDMLLETHRRSIIINAIADATQNDEFKLYYQPKICSSSGIVSGFEALIRWKNTNLGELTPSEFIPIAEAAGKISIVTHWIIGKVIEDLPKLKEISNDKIIVSFNISSYDLDNSWLTDYLKELNHKNPSCIKHLQFEITESSYLKDFTKANKFFSLVRAYGCSVALDDFGTGFSSLSYLSRIDIDTIKIDRAFIHHAIEDNRNRAILRLILDLSYSLDLSICCEGVESAEQAKFLILNGCNSMQGFYFSKAVPVEDIPEAILVAHMRYKEVELFKMV